MITVISPAKNLDFESQPTTEKFSYPELLEHSEELMSVCRELTPAQISSLMKISDKLAGLNAARFSEWAQPFTEQNAKQAVLAFNGDVYGGLAADTLTAEQLDYAQNHLRILSGLYGLLKPLDLMQAYRLEMGTKLDNSRGKNLYEFWGSIIAKKLNTVLAQQDSQYLVNLASNEYFKAVDKKTLSAQIITPHFKDCKNGQYKIISFYAKKARGLMARYIIENKVTQLSQLKQFTVDGYYFSEEATTKELEPVFLRDEQN
ncbi:MULTISPECIES: peroxide stress protein YaaA [unclassified Pseudoalteromonas]|uniref:peroxide stress protein YaaA n=1 Tax=unclassified Pseudoalteromonas TaxID=194690 RepID=UPI000B3C3727|nr:MULTISPECIES: peroxide stress protein YaaA [unclassified Pseudoalteromonas]MDN3378952.1 peroxide stress protein YaaA [Pseudoalteromonas sp. APC 3893]MDN3387598.1 peroxide stress protein YaaA [Pseudoalteromonas sp. APC 4017]OUS74075.1 peroxide stress protein YaaA [Pseudoalteromonas sp. A601]